MDSSTLPTEQSSTSICSYTIHFPTTATSPTQLVSLRTSLLALVHAISAGSGHPYLWHSAQPFNLQLSPLAFSAPANTVQQQHLVGQVQVTDCVDDEWFIVYLLREISREYPQAVIQVEDEDGQFLLIEGAEELPRWVTPTNAPNRVWIHNAHLHLVPLDHTSPLPFNSATSTSANFDAEEEGYLDRIEAIQLVRDSTIDTQAPAALEQIVWARIAGYPNQIRQHHHTTLAYLPTDIALALAEDPALITEAVKAFYEREPGTLKACNSMTRFPPSSPSAALTSTTAQPPTVLIPTLLTRPLYSQLVLQRFFAPKPFDKVGWNEGARDAGEERRRGVGMKLACGFEMLYAATCSQVHPHSSAEEVDPSCHPAYQAFLASLTAKNYFGTEVQGSAKWVELEKFARKGWSASREGSDEGEGASFAERVDRAIARARAREGVLHGRRVRGVLDEQRLREMEDDEAWLAMDEQGLEALLRERGPGEGGLQGEDLLSDEELPSDEEDDEEGGEKMEGVEDERTRREERRASKVARELQGMAGKVEEFVEGRGAVDGAEFDDEQSDDDVDSDDEDPASYPPLSPSERASRLEALVAPLASTEWGQKTAPPPLASSSTTAADGTTLPAREPKLTKESYDGASESEDEESEDEVMEGEEGLAGLQGSDVEGEEGPAVLGEEGGDGEMDMGEEMDEFLKFATETLGLTEEQYGRILGERKERGAFVPGPSKPKKTNVVPSADSSSSSCSTKTKAAPAPKVKPTVPNPPLRNPNLTDFDALMEQMDSELAKTRAAPKPSTPAVASKGKAKSATPLSSQSSNIVVDSDDSDEDEDDDPHDMAAMDAELASLFQSVSGHEPNAGEPVDLNLVKNFLESFQSQGGFGGPAGNLAGRLGFQLPRDA